MMQRNALRGLLLWVATTGWSASTGQESTVATQTSRTVSLCELTSAWKNYDHSTVQIEAIYASGAESSEVYDVNCPSRSDAAWVEFPDAIEKATPPEIRDKLNQLLRTDGRARVVVRGRFDGPKKVDIPPDTPPNVADVMRGVNSRYGHQNRWNFQFVFSKIEKVEPAPANAPWPRWATEKKQ
jgi:hypothetical protein